MVYREYLKFVTQQSLRIITLYYPIIVRQFSIIVTRCEYSAVITDGIFFQHVCNTLCNRVTSQWWNIS